MLLGHNFRLYLTIVFKRKFFSTIPKEAHNKPIFKRGDASVLTNYRPISVTPTFEKNFERLLLNLLLEYFENFALLNKKQFGFQSRKSSTDAVIYFIEKKRKNGREKRHRCFVLRSCKSFQIKFT